MSQPINEQMSSETLPGQTQGRAENITRQTAIPPYDTTRYILGKLCTHGHAYHGTGHSLRRLSDRECLECLKARRSAYRERQRQARPA